MDETHTDITHPVFFTYYCYGAQPSARVRRRIDRKLNSPVFYAPKYATADSMTGVVDGTYTTMDSAEAQCLHSRSAHIAVFIRYDKPLTPKQYAARLRAENKDKEAGKRRRKS